MRSLIIILAFLCFTSCITEREIEPLFKEVPNSGVSFNNHLPQQKNLNILNYLYFYNGAGVATADFNNDGLNDIYFTGNLVPDQLYLNQGKLQFKDITKSSNINNTSGWTTGVTTVDINNDGLMDIYVCKMSGYLHLKGHNLLYVNQGTDKEGIPQFKEQSKNYGIDISAYATQSIFFDYDLDGDLDLYLLNHSVYPNSNYGKGSKRNLSDALAGDKLFNNDNGFYKDVTETSGIYQGSIGYGLGLSVSDINNDGYPDIYIGNDFFENDYLYINQRNGTFKDINKNDFALGHTTHFSMGNTIADINNDLKPDIIAMDMLPERLNTLKRSAAEYNYPIYQRYIKNGYNHQFMQNTMHLNLGNNTFSEMAFLSGIAATEWSWSPLLADFDNDGFRDLYITNGIKGVTNDMDFINFISDEKVQKQLGKNMTDDALKFIEELPQKKVSNYMFQNIDGYQFKDVSDTWMDKTPSFSNGATYSDLDNDGDLDIIVNNVDENARIYENNTEHQLLNNYMKIALEGSENNKNGIGAKVKIYAENKTYIAENYTTNSYLSAKAPTLHFGLGTTSKIDSLKVIWPTKEYQTIITPPINTTLTVTFTNASGDYYKTIKKEEKQYFKPISKHITYKHKDQETLDFSRDPLLPYSLSNNSPDVAVSDINKDGLTDMVITGAKRQATEVWIQKADTNFEKLESLALNQDAISDDTSIVLVDVNGDKQKEIIIVSGGNEFKSGKALKPRMYRYQNNTLIKDSTQFKDLEINASKITTVDLDNDGDNDLCITANVKPQHFGETPKQYLLINDGKGHFKDVTEQLSKTFRTVGNVYDIVWVDIDANGYKDAVLVGHWMPISIFMNNGKTLQLLKNTKLSKTLGWWNTVVAEDFDNDGDIDIMAGNWGLNTRLTASPKTPITLYRSDFDNNNSKETLVTYFYKGEETPIATKDELVKQIPILNKNYLSYSDFAEASVEELFGKTKLKNAYKKQVTTLASCYFENIDNNNFKIHQLPLQAQISSINHILTDDLNNDGYKDVILTGNNFETSTQLGRLDALRGLALINDKKGFFNIKNLPIFDIFGQVRDIEIIRHEDEKVYVVARHKDSLSFYKTQN